MPSPTGSTAPALPPLLFWAMLATCLRATSASLYLSLSLRPHLPVHCHVLHSFDRPFRLFKVEEEERMEGGPVLRHAIHLLLRRLLVLLCEDAGRSHAAAGTRLLA